jgi:citrate lyase subunit beta / citryl-CoA lyase
MSRSVSLVVPGSSEKMLAKARELEVGEVVIDLEDAVVPDRKRDALAMVVEALGNGFAASRVSVRVNSTDSEWVVDELETLAACSGRLDSIVVPKVSGGDDLEFVDQRLTGTERRVQALIETASGVAGLAGITRGPERLDALILGYADLAVSLGRSSAGAASLDLWLAIQDSVLVAARAAGIRAIDGPFLAIDDADGLRASAQRAAALGFDGKWAIHPAQIDPIAAAFTPSDDEVAHAHAVLDALSSAEASGDGAVSLDGQMIDEPVRQAALRTLSLAGER